MSRTKGDPETPGISSVNEGESDSPDSNVSTDDIKPPTVTETADPPTGGGGTGGGTATDSSGIGE